MLSCEEKSGKTIDKRHDDTEQEQPPNLDTIGVFQKWIAIHSNTDVKTGGDPKTVHKCISWFTGN